MAIYVKPSGIELEVNDSSAETAISLGWKLKEEKPKAKAKAKPKAKADTE